MAELIQISKQLVRDVKALTFGPPVEYVYNPLEYAWQPFESYANLYGRGRKRVLFLGMNPGPWGMAQTGVPFGEVAHVRDWLGIQETVGKPRREHPKRPVQGFLCPRSETSGRRLWSLLKAVYGEPASFFKDHFIANYCPLVFMEESGRNRTPDKLYKDEKKKLFAACDRHLVGLIEEIKPEWLIGIGSFAESRFKAALDEYRNAASLDPMPKIARILHPSPASPAANRDWSGTAKRQLQDLAIW